MHVAFANEDVTMFPIMSPIAKKMTKILRNTGTKFKISEIHLGTKSQFTVYLGLYSEGLVQNLKKQFSEDEDIRIYNVAFRSGLKGAAIPKNSTYKLKKVS